MLWHRDLNMSFHMQCQMIGTRKCSITKFTGEWFDAGVLSRRQQRQIRSALAARRGEFLPIVSCQFVRSCEFPTARWPLTRVRFNT